MPAFAAAFPILPGKTDAWRQMCQEMHGPRRSAYQISRQRLGIFHESAFLQQMPQGDQAVVVLEAYDIEKVFRLLGSSTDTFDRWFRAQVLDIHGVDFAQGIPGPLPQRVLHWEA